LLISILKSVIKGTKEWYFHFNLVAKVFVEHINASVGDRKKKQTMLLK
jgi:hypothetical protein